MPEILRGGILITGVYPRPQATSNDINRNNDVNALDEYVEIFNSSTSDIDIGGLEFWDEFDSKWYTVPAGTVLAAGSSAVIMPEFDGGPGPELTEPGDIALDANFDFSILESTNESVVILDPNTNSYIQVDYGTGSPNSPDAWWGFPAGATRVGAIEDFGTPTNGLAFNRDPFNPDTITLGDPEIGTTPVCFADGTLILTDRGEVPVEALQAGDRVITLEGGAEPIEWTGGRWLSHAELAQKPKLWPIRIAAGALGPGLPARDLVVSPQHRILLANPVVERMIGSRQALVAAKHLQGLAGVESFLPETGISYLHIMLSHHRTLFAEGAPAESLFLGPQARQSLPKAALQEMADIFPELLRGESHMAPAREFMPGRQARKLTERLTKNRKPALADRL